MVPETDAERVDEQFKVFNRTFGPRVLKTLTEAVQRGESGCIRMFVNLKEGVIIGGNINTDFGVDLDAASG